MNDEAREVLVAAALRGHRQIRGRFHDRSAPEGECAMGVLHLAMHSDRAGALACGNGRSDPWSEVEAHYQFLPTDWYDIYRMNDEGADFLTIARKCGLPPESPDSIGT